MRCKFKAFPQAISEFIVGWFVVAVAMRTKSVLLKSHLIYLFLLQCFRYVSLYVVVVVVVICWVSW